MMNFYKKVQKPNFLPYKQRVTGSNPVAPTLKISHLHIKMQVADFF